jgi:hypothetical protein
MLRCAGARRIRKKKKKEKRKEKGNHKSFGILVPEESKVWKM